MSRSCGHSETECSACFRDRIRSIGFTGYRVSKNLTRDRTKRNDRELGAYRAARKEGIQPNGTSQKQVDEARALSDELGVAYRGDRLIETAEKAGLASSRQFTVGEKEVIRRGHR
jgi:hypothetical protein